MKCCIVLTFDDTNEIAPHCLNVEKLCYGDSDRSLKFSFSVMEGMEVESQKSRKFFHK